MDLKAIESCAALHPVRDASLTGCVRRSLLNFLTSETLLRNVSRKTILQGLRFMLLYVIFVVDALRAIKNHCVSLFLLIFFPYGKFRILPIRTSISELLIFFSYGKFRILSVRTSMSIEQNGRDTRYCPLGHQQRFADNKRSHALIPLFVQGNKGVGDLFYNF